MVARHGRSTNSPIAVSNAELPPRRLELPLQLPALPLTADHRKSAGSAQQIPNHSSAFRPSDVRSWQSYAGCRPAPRLRDIVFHPRQFRDSGRRSAPERRPPAHLAEMPEQPKAGNVGHRFHPVDIGKRRPGKVHPAHGLPSPAL